MPADAASDCTLRPFRPERAGLFCRGEILRAEGFPRHARVAERHTGTGLPGYEPETLEEQIICYADKFYSKSRPDRVLTVAETAQSLEKFGHEGVLKFLAWAERFE